MIEAIRIPVTVLFLCLATCASAVAQCAAPTQPGSLGNLYVGNLGTKYYVTQYGSDIWWVGFSSDGGKRFTNVFKGTLVNGVIRGDWADTTRGAFRNHGTLILTVVNNAYLAVAGQNGNFSEKALSLSGAGCGDSILATPQPAVRPH